MLPLAYGLLSNKTERSYKIFLELINRYAINNLNIQLNPKFIMTDFEIAAIKATRAVFPEVTHKCCYFHLAQNIWRHVKKEGLDKRYSTALTC